MTTTENRLRNCTGSRGPMTGSRPSVSASPTIT